MPDSSQKQQLAYDYAVLRVVPRVERAEFINAGVIVFAPQKRFLAARTHLDEARLKAGDPSSGPIALLPNSQRFHLLTSHRITMILVSPIRTGLSAEPETLLDHLTQQLVDVAS